MHSRVDAGGGAASVPGAAGAASVSGAAGAAGVPGAAVAGVLPDADLHLRLWDLTPRSQSNVRVQLGWGHLNVALTMSVGPWSLATSTDAPAPGTG